MRARFSNGWKNFFSPSENAYLICIFSLLFLVYFRARFAMRLGNVYDDMCYLNWLHIIVGEPAAGCYSNSHTPGVAFTWLPVGILSKGLAWMSSIPFDEWFVPLVGLYAFVCWALAAYFSLQAVTLRAKQLDLEICPSLGLLAFLNIPVLEYATRFTTGTHAPQILLAALMIYFLVKEKYFLSFVFVLWLTVTRLTDAASILLFAGGCTAGWKSLVQSPYRARVLAALGVFAVPVLVFGVAALYRVGFETGYNGVFLTDVLEHYSLAAVGRVLFHSGDGLFWIVPWLLLCVVLGWALFPRLSWLARGGLLWITVEILFLVGVTDSHPSFYRVERRYLIGSYVGAMLLWMEIYKLLPRHQWRLRFAAIMGAVWTLLYSYTGQLFHVFGRPHAFEQPFVLDVWNFFSYPRGFFELLGTSPLGFLSFSVFVPTGIFGQYSRYEKYALRGPELWILAIATAVAVYLLLKHRPRHKV